MNSPSPVNRSILPLIRGSCDSQLCVIGYIPSWRYSRPRLNDKQGAQQLIDFGFRVIIMSDLQLRQRQILNLFERVAQPLTPKPDIIFELPEFIVNFLFHFTKLNFL